MQDLAAADTPKLGVTSHVGWLKCCFSSIETVGLLGMGDQDGHLDFHTFSLAFMLLNVHGGGMTY